MSKFTPGLKVQVPVGAKSAWEHPQGDQIIVEGSSGKFYAMSAGKVAYEAKMPKPPWQKMTLQNPGLATQAAPQGGSWSPGASAPTGAGFAGKVSAAVKGAKGQAAGKPAMDPYWASQATAAGLDPNSAKLPPGPVVPKVRDRKLLETAHSQNQELAAKDQAKHGPRSTRARLGRPVPQTTAYRPRKPKAPAAK
jgi:hypothetical protein